MAALKRLGEELSAEEQVLAASNLNLNIGFSYSIVLQLHLTFMQHFLESNASASLASFAAATDSVDEKSITVQCHARCHSAFPSQLTRLLSHRLRLLLRSAMLPNHEAVYAIESHPASSFKYICLMSFTGRIKCFKNPISFCEVPLPLVKP